MPHEGESGEGNLSARDLGAAVDALLRAAGRDPGSDPDLKQTGRRVSQLWQAEFLAGYEMDPAAILGDPVTGEADPDVVVVGGLRFHAMCPHHLLPYRGIAHVAYLPHGKLVGVRPPGGAGRLLHQAAHAAGSGRPTRSPTRSAVTWARAAPAA